MFYTKSVKTALEQSQTVKVQRHRHWGSVVVVLEAFIHLSFAKALLNVSKHLPEC